MDQLKKLQRSLRRHWADDRAVSMVIVALAFTAIIAMVALIVDGGYAYGQRRQAQNAADAAALAGMRTYYLQRFPTEAARQAAARTVACNYAGLNLATDCIVTFPSANRLQVTAYRTFDTFFAGVIGYEQLTVSAGAKAAAGAVTTAGMLWPAIPEHQAFTTCYSADPCGSPSCPTYQIWDSKKEDAGNAGWLFWDDNPAHPIPNFPCGGGEPGLACELNTPGASGYWSVGDWVNGATGLKNGNAVRTAVDAWLCRHVTVPTWDQITGNGSNCQYRIAGFAEFVLTDADMTGNPKTISGQFIRWTEPVVSSTTDCTTGFCSLHLVP